MFFMSFDFKPNHLFSVSQTWTSYGFDPSQPSSSSLVNGPSPPNHTTGSRPPIMGGARGGTRGVSGGGVAKFLGDTGVPTSSSTASTLTAASAAMHYSDAGYVAMETAGYNESSHAQPHPMTHHHNHHHQHQHHNGNSVVPSMPPLHSYNQYNQNVGGVVSIQQ